MSSFTVTPCLVYVILTCPHANTHATHGDDAGDVQGPATLVTHQTLPGSHATPHAAGLFAIRLLTGCFLRLRLPRVRMFLVPVVAGTLSHDALPQAFGKGTLLVMERNLSQVGLTSEIFTGQDEMEVVEMTALGTHS